MDSKGVDSFERRSDLIAARIDDELVMMDPARGLYYALEGVAPMIWELLQSPRSVDELVTEVSRACDVPEKACRDDILAFIAELERLGLIKLA